MTQHKNNVASLKNRRYAHVWKYCVAQNFLEENYATSRDAQCITAHTQEALT